VGAQGIPWKGSLKWEGTFGNPREPMAEDPWGFPCEVTLGNPGDRPVGGSPRDRTGGEPCSWPWPTPPPGHGLSENANEIAENTH
jgi:hypothetical protein